MKVLIATPLYQDMAHARMAQGVAQFMRMCDSKGIGAQWMTVSSTYIQVGRDTLAHRFMHHGDWTHMFFIDSDIFFDPNVAMKLLEYHEKDVVCGLYPSKEIYWEGVQKIAEKCSPKRLEHCSAKNMVFRIPEEKGKEITDPLEPIEVTGAATGFMLIRRETMKKYADENPHENYDWGNEGNIVRFFKVGYLDDDPDKLYYGEDMYFCAMVRRLGLKIWVVPALNVKHIGQHIFEGCFWCCTGVQIHKCEGDK